MTRYSYAYRKRRERLKQRLLNTPSLAVCQLCGDPIDLSIPAGHPLSFEADHIIPTAAGGSEDGPLQPTHKRCNAAAKDKKKRKKDRTKRGRSQRDTAVPW